MESRPCCNKPKMGIEWDSVERVPPTVPVNSNWMALISLKNLKPAIFQAPRSQICIRFNSLIDTSKLNTPDVLKTGCLSFKKEGKTPASVSLNRCEAKVNEVYPFSLQVYWKSVLYVANKPTNQQTNWTLNHLPNRPANKPAATGEEGGWNEPSDINYGVKLVVKLVVFHVKYKYLVIWNDISFVKEGIINSEFIIWL